MTPSLLQHSRESVKTAPQIPSRRALAGLAVVTVLSTIEKRRKKQEQNSKETKPPIEVEDMSGELQTIPARHGVATFVPRGRTIKVINTYGKQVVSMWAFTLGAPPEDDDEDVPGDEEIEEEARKIQEAAEKEEGEGGKVVEPDSEGEEASDEKKTDEHASQTQTSVEKGQSETGKGEEAKKEHEEHEDPPEQAPDTPDNEKSTNKASETTAKQPSKRTWASYLPSIPYRGKGKGDKTGKSEVGQ